MGVLGYLSVRLSIIGCKTWACWVIGVILTSISMIQKPTIRFSPFQVIASLQVLNKWN